MIAVIGRRSDNAARTLVSRWQQRDTALLEPRDLSRPGWRHRPEAPGWGSAVVSGRVIALADIRAVVATCEAMSIYDLPHMAPDERL